jgi:hypothetical protein
MTTREIKKMVEQVVRVEYIATDGTVFYNEAECKKYEESAKAILSSKLKKLGFTTEWDILETGNAEDPIEIFDVATSDDLENLKRYLYVLSKEYYKNNESKISEKMRTLEKLTYGHEVLVFMGYDNDFFVLGDGSFDAWLNSIRTRMEKFMNGLKEPKTSENE